MASQEMTMDNSEDFAQLDDSELLRRRAEMRAELEQLPAASPGHAALAALYDRSTAEVNERARAAWSKSELSEGERMNGPLTVEATISNLSPKVAKMVAVEILLADPESLHDDALEACLYILRERLRETE
jgi:hypothetical protein